MSNYTEGIRRAVGEGFFYGLNVLGEGPPKRRSRVGNREAQLLGGPTRPAG